MNNNDKINDSAVLLVAASLVAATVVLACFFLSNQERKFTHAAVGMLASVVASIVSVFVVKKDEFHRREISFWILNAVIGIGMFVALFGIDAAIGLLAYPELPFYEAAQKHIGFVMTAFISPIFLVAPICAIRQFLLNWKEKRNH